MQDSISPVVTRLAAAIKEATAVEAVVSERRQRTAALEKTVAEARYRLERQPEVESYMLTLQQRVHQRSVGLYEQLLTALIQDVLPENVHPISLELDTEKGLPALHIQLGKGEFAQDIYEDTGGSLTNVVSSGLRFIALARSGLRKFMVLDEPDCWIEPHRVPRFADILSDMASRIHVQAILISHHNDSAFTSIPDRHVLGKNAQGVIEVRKSRGSVWPDDVTPGIRWIRLQRFMSHLDTTLELGPGINVLSGPNHIGKSAIVNALRAFCYQKGADRQIMHGHGDFVISMGLEGGKVLTCTRVRKGARKTTYSYMDPSMAAPRVEPAEKTHPPDFVLQHLNIQRLNDLDIQLSHQKMPVFLLNEPNTKQAALLSAGLEADHVRTMLKEYKCWLDADRLAVRTSEKEYLALKQKLDAWDERYPAGGLAASGEALSALRLELEVSAERLKVLVGLSAAIEQAQRLQAVDSLAQLPEKPVLVPSEGMVDLATRWERSERKCHLEPSVEFPEMVDLPDLSGMASMLRQWAQMHKRAVMLEGALGSMVVPTSPSIETNRVLDDTVSGLVSLHAAEQTTEKAHAGAAAALQTAQSAYESVRAEVGDTCPLCQQHWPHQHEEIA